MQNTDLVQAFITKNLNVFKICFLRQSHYPYTPNKYKKFNSIIFIFIELDFLKYFFLCDDYISKAKLILSYLNSVALFLKI